MSYIVIQGGPSELDARLKMKLAKILKRGVSEFAASYKKDRVILQKEMFLNNHDELSDSVRQVLSELKDSGVSYMLYELEEGDELDPDLIIEDDTLENIIEGS
jgi:hypothetical protein